MKTVLENLANLPRDRWTRCAFEKSQVDAAGIGDEARIVCEDGRVFRAVKGRNIRDHSTVFRVLAQLSGDERIEGTLQSGGVHPTPPKFTAHPWVADDVAELVPKVIVVKDGTPYESQVSAAPKLVDSSAAHQRYHLQATIDYLGMVFEWWVEFGHLDPVAECWGKLVWSNRLDPQEATRVDAVVLKTGELYVDYFAKRKGMGAPIAAGTDWLLEVSKQRDFADGTGLDFYGQMLCWISDPNAIPTELDLEEDNGWISWSIRSLYAAWTGMPVTASGVKWLEPLAAKNAPRLSKPGALGSELAKDWQRFVDSLKIAGDFYDDRPFGVGWNPPGTGAKEDFGAIKGTYVLVGEEPKALHMLAYSVMQDLYRPGSNLYEFGKPLDPTQHPNWITWSGYTHYHPGVSMDRLGKTASSFGFPNLGVTGTNAYDDQHRSQNNLCAVLALWDDPLAESLVRMASIPDAAMLLGRVGATRAAGRLFGAWSQFVLLLDDGIELDRFNARINEKLANVYRRLNNQSTPVRVVSSGGPDPRKQVYDLSGNLGHWWSVWEHGLFAVGCYNLYKATGDRRALDSLIAVCESVVNHALFQENGQWYLPDDVWWNGGTPLPASSVSLNSRQMVVSPGIGGTTSWAFCAVLIATEVLSGPDSDRAREAVRFFTGGREATNRTTAEWWACVATVSP